MNRSFPPKGACWTPQQISSSPIPPRPVCLSPSSATPRRGDEPDSRHRTQLLTPTPVARSTYTYSGANLTGLLHADPSETVLREYDWTYANSRIVTEATDDYYTADEFIYDDEGQLTEVIGGVEPAEYHYGATGNRTTVDDFRGSTTYTVDAFNRVTGVHFGDHEADIYEYDAEGNRTAKYHWVDAYPWEGVVDPEDTFSDRVEYTWDARNRLTCVTFKNPDDSVAKTVTFAYDYLNRWIATEVDTTPATPGDETGEYFVYGGTTLPDEVAPWDRAAVDSRDIGQITLRLNEDGEITNRYLWGPAVDQILADEQVDWNAGAHDYDIDQILWPLTDHLGTIRDLAAVNATTGDTEILNTRSYDAYGILLAETDPTVDHLTGFTGFTGRPTQTDAGLVNCLNRWYDPVIASWITEDPISFRGGDANLYRYCGNDPVNSVDPSGLDPFLLEHGWMERQGLFGRRAEAPDHRPRDSEPFQFQYWPEANRLYEHYLLQKKLGATKNEQVAGLVVKALIITNGDARKAFDLVYTMRNYGRGFPDNDIWAGTDHFLQNFVMQDYLSVESIPALDGLASFAGSISGFVANAYTLLKYSDFIRLNLLPRDKTGVPPSRPTWDQYEWGNAGAWAALWYSNKMHPTSPEWKSFIRWLDDITTPRPPVDDVPLYELGY